jgi:cell division protein ZapB
MEQELADFEARLNHFVQLFQRLRSENNELRQQIALRSDEARRLEERLDEAKSRIEALLRQIPETEP